MVNGTRTAGLSVEDASIHCLVDTGTRGGDGGGADWCRPLDGLRVDSHRRILAADCKIPGSDTIVVMGHPWFAIFLLLRLQRIKIVARLDQVVGFWVVVLVGIWAVRKREVSMK